MPSLKSLVAVSSFFSAALADHVRYSRSESYTETTSPTVSAGGYKELPTSHPNATSSAYDDDDEEYISYVTEIVSTTTTLCPAGQTVTVDSKPYVLPTPSISTLTFTKTVTVCPKCTGKPAFGKPESSSSNYGPGKPGSNGPSPGSGSGAPSNGSPGKSGSSPTSSSGSKSGSNSGSVNNSPWKSGGRYPLLSELIGDGECYPPGLNAPGPNLPGKNPVYGGPSGGYGGGYGNENKTMTSLYSKASSSSYVPYSKSPSHPHASSAQPIRTASGSKSTNGGSVTSSYPSYSSDSSRATASASFSGRVQNFPIPGSNSAASSSGSSAGPLFSSVSSVTASGLSSVTGSSSSLSISLSSVASSVTSSASASLSSSISASPSASACPFWMEDIKHQGKSAFNSDSNYTVFRNVKDFGAKGDGVTDDTDAINSAISSGGRCAPGTCASSTTTPAVVYFPPGTYLISNSIIDYYYTQIIGNPNCLPVLKASSSFTSRFFVDGDQYVNGNLGWGSTNVFWRQIRNFVIDLTSVPATVNVAGIHWPTAQATSLQNIVFKMSSDAGTQHEGIFIESGSGGFMSDLIFFGGLNGATVGNQQFTMRNLTFFNSGRAINQLWDWGWTYKGLSINNCSVGIDMSAADSTGALSVGSVVVIDSTITNTPIGIKIGRGSNTNPPTANSLILEQVTFDHVATAIQGPNGTTVLVGSPDGQQTVAAWGQGNQYTPSGPTTFQGSFSANTRPASLVAGSDYYEQSKPQYESLPASSFLSARDAGAVGDGTTDDSDAIQHLLFSALTAGKVVYFDAGTYLVTKTIYIPSGSKIVGESYPVIMSSGSLWADSSNPAPVLKVGDTEESGSIEWSDMIVSTKGSQGGAILIEYNLNSPRGSGIWDVHTRVGGFAGSELQVTQCLKQPGNPSVPEQCKAAFMSMHVTNLATGLYMENSWLWVADHDIEDTNLTQISIFAGRGLLIESSAGGIWLYGTAVEHHALYQYNLVNTKEIFMGQIQTETAYYQPIPPASNSGFAPSPIWSDPTVTDSGYGLRVLNSQDILVYGAGLYSFFSNYDVSCSQTAAGDNKCQRTIFLVEGGSKVSVYNTNTVGANKMISLDTGDVADWADNKDGFISTVALFRN